MDDLVKELTLEMLPESCREIAESIGMATFVKLVEIAGGTALYLPKYDTLLRPVRDHHIKDEFNGYNYTELSSKYNVTERWVRIICGEGYLEGQQTLFDSS